MFVSGLCVVRCAAKWKGSRRCRNKGRVVEQPTHPHTRHITTNEHAPLTPCLTCHADYHLRSIPLGQTGTIRTQVRRHNTGIQVLGRRKKKKMKATKRPIHAVTTWLRRQPPKIKVFLAVLSGLVALLFLRMAVHDHDNLFVAAELVHALGISVLIYKLTKEKTCAGTIPPFLSPFHSTLLASTLK